MNNRDMVLQHATEIIEKSGSQALTHGNLAKKAGISKGGVQSLFGTKGGLIEALVEEWVKCHNSEIASDMKSGALSGERANIVACTSPTSAKIASIPPLLAGIAHGKGTLSPVRDWYARNVGDGHTVSEEDRKVRIAFFAAEGLFLLKHLGLMNISAADFRDTGNDIKALLKDG